MEFSISLFNSSDIDIKLSWFDKLLSTVDQQPPSNYGSTVNICTGLDLLTFLLTVLVSVCVCVCVCIWYIYVCMQTILYVAILYVRIYLCTVYIVCMYVPCLYTLQQRQYSYSDVGVYILYLQYVCMYVPLAASQYFAVWIQTAPQGDHGLHHNHEHEGETVRVCECNTLSMYNMHILHCM